MIINKMETYKSATGKDSGVTGYVTGENYIIVRFDSNRCYKYIYHSAGKNVIETMKLLAIAQSGLSTFISRYDPGFEEKEV